MRILPEHFLSYPVAVAVGLSSGSGFLLDKDNALYVVTTSLVPGAWFLASEELPKSPNEGPVAAVPIKTITRPTIRPPKRPPPKRLLSMPILA